MKPSIFAAVLPLVLVACTETKIVEEVDPSLRPDGGGGAQTEPTVVSGATGTLFGGAAESYAKTDAEGIVVAVGMKIAMTGLESGPANHPFQDDLILAMPDVAVAQTMAGHMRMNWLGKGHSPTPYGMAHWDLHFITGTESDSDKIDCRSGPKPTAEVIPPGYGAPNLCVAGSGDHSWPTADLQPGAKFSASIIMGFWQNKISFIEPMITQATITKKADFEVAIPKPTTSGNGALLYPTRFTAHWDDASSTWTFELDTFVTLE